MRRCWWKSLKSLWMCCRSNNKGLIFVPKIFYICQKFLPPFFDLISRRKRRRLSLSDTVLAVTWLGIHRIFRNSNTVHSLQVHHQHLILLKLNKTSHGVHLIPTKPLFILIIIPTIRLTAQAVHRALPWLRLKVRLNIDPTSKSLA